MLIQTIGIINVEKLEKKINLVKQQVLNATLDTLKTYCNAEAHTHLKGVTRRLDAPSIKKSRFFKYMKDLRTLKKS